MSSSGFGLIELMVALTLGLLLVLAVGQVYLTMRSSQSAVNNVSDLQENSRFISERLKREVRMAGYLGAAYQKWQASESTVAPLPASGNECFTGSTAGAGFRWVAPIAVNAIGEPPPKIYGADGAVPFGNCLSSSSTNLLASSDVLSLHFAAPTRIAAASMKGPRYYLQTSVSGVFGFFCASGTNGASCIPSDAPAATVGTEYYPLVSRIYYVRDYAQTVGDGIPTLVTTQLSGSQVDTQPLVEGVAVFQLSFGLDNDGDGAIDIYRTATQIGDLTSGNLPVWNRVKTVEVRYVLRGIEPDASRVASTNIVYSIDGTNYTVDGRFMSREYRITAGLRNVGARAAGR